MKLEKTIEILDDMERGDNVASPEDCSDALKLGIEALKNLQYARSLVSRSSYRLLPSETED